MIYYICNEKGGKVMEKKKIPELGSGDFRQLITENRYYVDKTKFILDIIENGEKVALYTRPRRFRKKYNNINAR